MHISEGVLPPEILAAGAVLAIAGAAVGLKKTRSRDIPAMGILSAAFFVASLIHIPVGPVSAHLVLNGLLGMVLGWRAFPAILTGVMLQALLFQFGGLTAIGVNAVNMALPAVLCFLLFGKGARPDSGPRLFMVAAFACGFFSVLFSAALIALSLSLAGEAFVPAAKVAAAAHLPLMVIEGVVTSACAMFLRKTKPELLGGGK
jgi:cobalt/nickel transport system permease protein